MSVNVPAITAGNLATPVTITSTGRQLLVENTDTLQAFTVKINGSTTGWRLEAGTRLGIRVDGGIISVVLTAVAGSPTYQVLIA